MIQVENGPPWFDRSVQEVDTVVLPEVEATVAPDMIGGLTNRHHGQVQDLMIHLSTNSNTNIGKSFKRPIQKCQRSKNPF